MTPFDYDLFTIGAGSGGVAASRRAASHGAKVAICEADRVGGTCVLRGCVPKKLLVYGSHFREEFEDAAGFGWTLPGGGPAFDWGRLIAAKDRELDRLNQVYERMLRDANVEIHSGRARLVDPHTVEVAGRTFTAAHILCATGSWPLLPQVRGIEHVITSNEALSLPALPRRLLIVGGGYIAVEFAGIFNALGVAVTLAVRGDTVLRGFDQDIRTQLSVDMSGKGIKLLVDTVVRSIEKEPDGSFSVNTGHEEMLETDLVMYATGRAPHTAGLGLAQVGVALDDNGAVKVDPSSRSSVPSIFAIGDCTDRLNLTPVAIAEGRALAETLFHNNPMVIDHCGVPTAVFSQPPVGTVGLTEQAAREQLGAIDVYISSFRPMKSTMTGRQERTMMKLVVEQKSQRVVGCHMVGPDAPEIIQCLGIALRCGATKAHFDATVGVHPTAAEEFVTMHTRRPEPMHLSHPPQEPAKI